MKHTKITAGLLTLLLIFSLLLTGCGKAPVGGSTGGSTTTTTLDGASTTTTTLGPQDDHDEDWHQQYGSSTTKQPGGTTTGKGSTTTKRPNAGTTTKKPGGNTTTVSGGASSINKIPAYSGNPFVTVNGNQPNFTAAQKKSTKSYETYGALDSLGRCTTAIACIGKDLMPTGDRGDISSVTPTGWKQAKYNSSIVPGGYLYNRAHLIGWQLTGENDNEKNLITGTQYLNIEGMLPFENMIADYLKEEEPNHHVLYRVTPIFEGNNLLASGVQLEAYSIEDDGEGICFNVYCYNVQPKITINYKDGSSYQTGTTTTRLTVTGTYILNTNPNSMKIHKESCSYAKKISAANKATYTGALQDKLDEGYSLCLHCLG